MSAELESRLVFVDTSAYERKNYQFNEHALGKLCDFLESDRLHLLITQITINEIKAHLLQKSEESAKAIKKIQYDAMFLRNTPELACHGIFEKVKPEDIYKIVLGRFEDFLNKSSAEIVDIKSVDSSIVFDKYFKSEPPFGGANKKSEFPDAFVLEAVSKISKDRGQTLYVISDDGDMQKYAETLDNLIHLNSVDKFLDLVVRNEEELNEPVKFADSIFEQLEASLIESAKGIIGDSEFYSDAANGFDDEIYKIEIESICIKNKNIISVSGEQAEYEVDFKVILKAQYSIADYDRSPWDSEDKVYIFLLYSHVTKKHTEVFSAYVCIDYMEGIRANAEITELDFTESAFELNEDRSEIISVIS
ncbi:PIN domain-containing protein [Shewanella sp. SP1S1-7]|uniref:PIN domain-containing protein n=1 Tax=Shewanella sp. SP1S1-7 TaxID=3063536 RepID=UPI00288CBA53|nr:PIN domain-containing protein [Shewanella sp. SP1S1-7]MDT3334138.1 PIN domain-containing protein [Shewanella sp. SP1S1-7]